MFFSLNVSGRYLWTHWNCQNLSLEQWSLGGWVKKPGTAMLSWEKHGKPVGKPWENIDKTNMN